MSTDCPFCADQPRSADGELAYSRLDRFPVAAGHTLIVLTRHEGNLLNATSEEWQALWDLTRSTAAKVLNTPGVDGVNVGANIGTSAGQTVDHAHIHIIPRSSGDQADPRGGVRRALELSSADTSALLPHSRGIQE